MKFGIFVCLLSATSSVEGFVPTTLSTRTAVPSTELYMNKKKSKKKTTKSSGQGFASALKNLQTKAFPYAGGVRPGKQSPQRVVVEKGITLPDYAKDGMPKKGSSSPLLPWVIEVKTADEIEKMRAAGKLAREILDMAGRAVAAGVTTDEIDILVHDAILEVRMPETERSLPF